MKRLYQKHIKYSVDLLKAEMPRTKKAASATKRCHKSSDSKTKPEKDTGPSYPKKTRTEKEETSKYFGNDASDPVITNPSAAKTSDGDRMQYKFFDVSCEDLAMALLGQKLVHVVDGKRLTGIIVETEAYLGPIDKGAHSYEGKRTAKNEAMYMPPGTAYVYNIYGLYCCMNISAKGINTMLSLKFQTHKLLNSLNAGRFFMLLSYAEIFFKILQQFFQKHFQSVDRFGSRLGLKLCWS